MYNSSSHISHSVVAIRAISEVKSVVCISFNELYMVGNVPVYDDDDGDDDAVKQRRVIRLGDHWRYRSINRMTRWRCPMSILSSKHWQRNFVLRALETFVCVMHAKYNKHLIRTNFALALLLLLFIMCISYFIFWWLVSVAFVSKFCVRTTR